MTMDKCVHHDLWGLHDLDPTFLDSWDLHDLAYVRPGGIYKI